jgi:hypothetical protein
VIGYAFEGSWSPFASAYVVYVVVYGSIAAVGGVLWVFAGRLATFLLPRQPVASFSRPMQSQDLLKMFLAAIGVVFFGVGLSHLPRAYYTDVNTGILKFSFQEALGPILQMGFGIVLFLRGNGLVVLWDHIRTTKGKCAESPATEMPDREN